MPLPTCWTLLLSPSSAVFTSAIVVFRALMSVWFLSMASPFVDILILVLHWCPYFLWLTQFSYSSLSSFHTSLLNYVLEKVDLRRFILVLWAVFPRYTVCSVNLMAHEHLKKHLAYSSQTSTVGPARDFLRLSRFLWSFFSVCTHPRCGRF